MIHPQQHHQVVDLHPEMFSQFAPPNQPTIPNVDSQVRDITNTLGRSSHIRQRKRRMNTEERGVHNLIREFYKRMEKVGELLSTKLF